jgi:hypothetical protein
MRLDHVDSAWTAKLLEVCAKCANRKLKEFGKRAVEGETVDSEAVDEQS